MSIQKWLSIPRKNCPTCSLKIPTFRFSILCPTLSIIPHFLCLSILNSSIFTSFLLVFPLILRWDICLLLHRYPPGFSDSTSTHLPLQACCPYSDNHPFLFIVQTKRHDLDPYPWPSSTPNSLPSVAVLIFTQIYSCLSIPFAIALINTSITIFLVYHNDILISLHVSSLNFPPDHQVHFHAVVIKNLFIF